MSKLVLDYKSLPSRTPGIPTAVIFLLLDRFHAAGWLWGVAFSVIGLLWIAVVVSIFQEKKISIEQIITGIAEPEDKE